MAKVQTRRGFSIRGELHARFKARCEADGISMSERVERLLADIPDVPFRPRAGRPPMPAAEHKASPCSLHAPADAHARIAAIAAERGTTMLVVADETINRMLDHLEQHGVAS